VDSFQDDANGPMEPQSNVIEPIKVPMTCRASTNSTFKNSTPDLNLEVDVVAEKCNCPFAMANNLLKRLPVRSYTLPLNLSNVAIRKDK
jgi:hypothetical protein